MGTHPIFESDFDCLTESKKMSFVRDRRLHDLTVDNAGKLGLLDPTEAAENDFNADFQNTMDDTNQLTGLLCELAKKEVATQHKQQIDEVLVENGINFDRKEISTLADEIDNFNKKIEGDIKVINMKKQMKAYVRDVDSGIQFVIDMARNATKDEITWEKVSQLIIFSSWVFKYVVELNSGKTASVVLEIIGHFVKYLYCYIRDIVLSNPAGHLVRQILFKKWRPTIVMQVAFVAT